MAKAKPSSILSPLMAAFIIFFFFPTSVDSHGRSCNTPEMLAGLNSLVIKAKIHPEKIPSTAFFTKIITIENTATTPLVDVFVLSMLPKGIAYRSFSVSSNGLTTFSTSDGEIKSTVFTMPAQSKVAFAYQLKADRCFSVSNITFVNDVGIYEGGASCYWHANVKQVSPHMTKVFHPSS